MVVVLFCAHLLAFRVGDSPVQCRLLRVILHHLRFSLVSHERSDPIRSDPIRSRSTATQSGRILLRQMRCRRAAVPWARRAAAPGLPNPHRRAVPTGAREHSARRGAFGCVMDCLDKRNDRASLCGFDCRGIICVFCLNTLLIVFHTIAFGRLSLLSCVLYSSGLELTTALPC